MREVFFYRRTQERLPRQRTHSLASQQPAHYPHCDLQSEALQESLQNEREYHGGHGAAERDDPVNDAQVPLEVVPQDDDRRRVDERDSQTSQDTVRQVQ